MAYLGNAPVVGDSTNSFKLLDDIASFTLTFDETDTSVVSFSGDTLSFTNHRLVTGQKVTYTDGGGTAIGGLTDGTSYFIIKVDQNTIKLATSASNAASSTAINLTSGAAGGSHTLNVKFDGVNTKFKATFNNGRKASISRAGQISLSINGVIQQPQDTSSPSVGYGVEADSTIVFSTAPVATDVVFGTFIGEVAASFDIEDNTIDNFTGDGSTTIFNLSKEVPSSQDVLVTLDGVTQHPSDASTTRSYSVIDQALTFVSAPATGVAIQARHIGFAGATTSAVTGFYGRTGNAALISTDDISVQNISAGIATFNTIAVGGTVSIGGTLTYEDVTNIDSVGLVTARNGIVVGSGITLSKDGDIFATGVTTSTTFVGDLTGNVTGAATQITLTDQSGDTTCNVLFAQSATGNQLPHTGTNLTFNSASGALTATSFSGSGADLTDLNASNLASGTVPTARLGSGTASSSTFLRGDSTFQTVNTDLVSDTSPQLGGDLDTNDHHILLDQDHYLYFITNGGSSFLGKTASGLYLQNNGDLHLRGDDVYIRGDDNSKMGKFIEGGAVELYHNASKKFETTSSGLSVSGANTTGSVIKGSLTLMTEGGSSNIEHIGANGTLRFYDSKKATFGTGDDLSVYHDGSDSYISHNGTGNFYVQTSEASVEDLYLQAGNDVYIRPQTGDNGIKVIGDGAVELYYDNDKKFNTNSGGVAVHGDISLGTDDYKIKFGTGEDLKIYSDGTNGILEGGGSGNNAPLFLNANTIRLKTQTGGETYIDCQENGMVKLYYDNELRIFTNSDGMQVKNETLLRFKKETSTSGEVTAIQFEKDNPTNVVGRIRYDNGQTHYNTTSDYRLKENNVAITDGITRISQLKPYRFNFKVDPSKTVDGFFAHEVSSVLPEAISGEKDAVRDVLYNAQDVIDGTLPDGKSIGDVKESGVIDPQEIDQAKLVPLLVAAVQELIAEVEKLKSS